MGGGKGGNGIPRPPAGGGKGMLGGIPFGGGNGGGGPLPTIFVSYMFAIFALVDGAGSGVVPGNPNGGGGKPCGGGPCGFSIGFAPA